VGFAIDAEHIVWRQAGTALMDANRWLPRNTAGAMAPTLLALPTALAWHRLTHQLPLSNCVKFHSISLIAIDRNIQGLVPLHRLLVSVGISSLLATSVAPEAAQMPCITQ